MKSSKLRWVGILAAMVCSSVLRAQADPAGQLAWEKQLGSSDPERSCGVSADGLGSVYVSGTTWGSLGGPSAGGHDAFVAKFDATGRQTWCRQLGTSSDEDLYNSVSADTSGNVYISGYTFGSLGGANAGSSDAFLAKYNSAGGLMWCRQLGTTGTDGGQGVSTDRFGNVYITGVTNGSLGGTNAGGWDTFVSKYDPAGNFIWSRQFGTSGSDYVNAVSADGLGNAYVSGYITGSGNADGGFVAKYSSNGTLVWRQQLGTSASRVWGVSADALGNVFISGDTTGSLGGPNIGGFDVFVAKYDALGSLKWCRQFGTSAYDEDGVVSADGQGNVYVGASTMGNLGGANVGGWDSTLSKLDSQGTLLWSCQLGTTRDDYAGGVSVDGLGHVYLGGDTSSPSGGYGDVFLAAYSVPEPPTSALMFGAVVLFALFCCRRTGGQILTWSRNGDAASLEPERRRS